MKIITVPNPILRAKAKRVESTNEAVERVISNMIQIMYAAKGVGIAAPQIGVSLRIIAWDFYYRRGRQKMPYVLINPQAHIEPGNHPMQLTYRISEEGCLSVPGEIRKVRRLNRICVTGMQLNGIPKVVHAINEEACVLQHEIDHLNGKLIIDYQRKK